MNKKIIAFAAALAMTVSAVPAAAMPERVLSAGESEGAQLSSESAAAQDTGIVHAYDPMAEIEAQQAEQEFRDNAEFVEKTVLFSVRETRSMGQTALYLSDESSLCKDHGLKNVEFIMESREESCPDTYDVFYQAAVSTDDVWKFVDELNEDGRIVSAEPDYIWKNTAEGGYTEVTAEEFAKETHFPCMDISHVWDWLFGEDVKAPGYGTVVAVIDTGVDYTHFDLKDSMWKNTGEIADNGIDDDGNGFVDDVYGYDFVENDGDPMDDHGHGTHVSGIIAMSPGNGGGVGVAYGAKIMAVKAGQATGSFASTDIAKAINYAAANGADVINMSFGGTGKSYLVETALRDASHDCVLVAAAGNDGLPTTDAIPYQPMVEDCRLKWQNGNSVIAKQLYFGIY